ncbi:importin alpha [Anaeramoeba ignava]|uniref:Importin alpha n=1 Tax=Anaeramoeba ignava TaxID=1746090 RepID=A0A9Q0LIK9_ANAIG|nr:importin alpha [Anaeramoeba ignava]
MNNKKDAKLISNEKVIIVGSISIGVIGYFVTRYLNSKKNLQKYEEIIECLNPKENNSNDITTTDLITKRIKNLQIFNQLLLEDNNPPLLESLMEGTFFSKLIPNLFLMNFELEIEVLDTLLFSTKDEINCRAIIREDGIKFLLEYMNYRLNYENQENLDKKNYSISNSTIQLITKACKTISRIIQKLKGLVLSEILTTKSTSIFVDLLKIPNEKLQRFSAECLTWISEGYSEIIYDLYRLIDSNDLIALLNSNDVKKLIAVSSLILDCLTLNQFFLSEMFQKGILRSLAEIIQKHDDKELLCNCILATSRLFTLKFCTPKMIEKNNLIPNVIKICFINQNDDKLNYAGCFFVNLLMDNTEEHKKFALKYHILPYLIELFNSPCIRVVKQSLEALKNSSISSAENIQELINLNILDYLFPLAWRFSRNESIKHNIAIIIALNQEEIRNSGALKKIIQILDSNQYYSIISSLFALKKFSEPIEGINSEIWRKNVEFLVQNGCIERLIRIATLRDENLTKLANDCLVQLENHSSVKSIIQKFNAEISRLQEQSTQKSN